MWRCSFYPEAGETPEDALAPAAIQRHLDEISPDIGAIEILEKRAYRVHRRIAGRYRAGRLFIAGDAAHLNSPKGGMGMNGGIHDAFALVRRIAQVRDGGDPALLDGYEAERRPVARDDILAQADDNRARMHETAEAARTDALKRLQEIAADPVRAHAFLLKSSMIGGIAESGGGRLSRHAPLAPLPAYCVSTLSAQCRPLIQSIRSSAAGARPSTAATARQARARLLDKSGGPSRSAAQASVASDG